MPFVIYRKSDRLVCGFVRRKDSATENIQLFTEIDNIVNSELGGTASDYTYLPLDRMKQSDEIIEITADGKVVYKPNPQVIKERADRSNAVDKLTALGLTIDEVKAITG